MDQSHLAAGQLLKSFFSECERHFRFLEQRYGYGFFCGLCEYQNNYKIIKPFNGHNDISDSFIAVTRYEHSNQAIEIVYNSDQFFMDGYVFYSPADRFGFSEILNASQRADPRVDSDWGITDNVLITRIVERFAQGFKKNASLILNPQGKILDKALRIRHSKLETVIKKRHNEDIKLICEQAALAFREQNYRLVVKLLEPYKNYLKQADLKKLDRAKKYLLS